MSERSGDRRGGIGAFWRTNITWKSGERLMSRSGCAMLTSSLERKILVRVRLDRRLSDPAKQLAESRVAREVAAQDQRVDEEPDQALQLRASSPGDRRPDGEIFLTRVAVQEAPGTPPARSCTESRPRVGRVLAPLRESPSATSSTARHRAGSRQVGRGRSVGSSRSGTPASWFVQ